MKSKRLARASLLPTILIPFVSGCSLFSGGGGSEYDPFAPKDVVDGMFYSIDTEGGYAVFNGIYDNVSFDKAYKGVKTLEVKAEYKGYPVQEIVAGAMAYGDCSSIEEVVIPSSVKTIGRGAFATCTNLKKIVLNEGLEVIENGVFNQDYLGPVDFTLPSTLRIIGDDALPVSSNTLTIPSAIEEIGTRSLNWDTFDEINLPSTLRKLAVDAFYEATARRIIMSDEIETLPNEAFYYMKGVESIHLSNNLKVLPARSFAFIETAEPENDEYVIEITGGESIERIEDEACLSEGIRLFPYSSVLVNIAGDRSMYYVGNRDFPSGLHYINPTAFGPMSRHFPNILASYPRFLSSVPDYLFYKCNFDETEITIELGENGYIGEATFADSSLTQVNIIGTRFSIKSLAFSGCQNLESISFSGTIEQFENITKGANWNKGIKATYVQCRDGRFEM